MLLPEETAALRELLGGRTLRRDELIEYLHVVHDAEGCLPAGHLHALAEAMRLPMAEVFEVASFYAHFDIVLDGEPRPPALSVRVCDSLSCMLAGADAVRAALEKDTRVRILRAPCMGQCDAAPVAHVGHRTVAHATADSVRAVIASGHTHTVLPAYQTLDSYRAEGGTHCLRACLDGTLQPDDVIRALSDAGLRGLGGAGFPTGRKWGLVRAEPGPRLMAVNGDEGEPGTFKDRTYLESRPHQFLEGLLIGAWAVEAADVYIYLRDEYPAARAILTAEIAAVVAAGLAPHTRIHLRRGAGAYICGEESAMLESIEGKRGLPRHRPPYVAQVGLFGRPTLVNNIETLFWVPQILDKGALWFESLGQGRGKGVRSYSVSGRVARPGVVVAPAGSTANELIARCGGMADGHVLKGYLPGGASGGILPASMADLPLDFGQLEKYGSFVGSHAVVILSEHDNMRDVAVNLMRFFEDESCGQCTPCRSGTEKAVQLMQAVAWDKALLEELAQVMADASICGLGQAAPNPLRSLLKYFPQDVP